MHIKQLFFLNIESIFKIYSILDPSDGYQHPQFPDQNNGNMNATRESQMIIIENVNRFQF